MRHYRDLFYRNVNGLLLTHTQFQISLAAKWSEAWRLWLMSERVLQAPAHRVYIHALVQSSRVPPHWWILQLKDGHLECWLCLLWDHEVPLRGKGSVFHLLYLNRTAAHRLKRQVLLDYMYNYNANNVCFQASLLFYWMCLQPPNVKQMLWHSDCCIPTCVSVWILSSLEPMSWTRLPRSTMYWGHQIRASSKSSRSRPSPLNVLYVLQKLYT